MSLCSWDSSVIRLADRTAYMIVVIFIILRNITLSIIFIYSALWLTSVSRRALVCCGVSPARADAVRSAYYFNSKKYHNNNIIFIIIDIIILMYSALWLTFVSRRAFVCCGVSPARADAERSAYYYNSKKYHNIIFIIDINILLYLALRLTFVSRRALVCCGVSPARADAERSAYYYSKKYQNILFIFIIDSITSVARRVRVLSSVSVARFLAFLSA